ncbi:hypothetical protein DMH12_24890 [Streptomyces sp. WAC 04229]|uniref:hypothetical protein n=1 Tax=Streptomyces sp. WAC 04229 TaxID=2203206 RepID=UPI000F73CE69|nr:hypothetical protein [Streptomyces sp. WAC 04229]RSN50522.1 hypothetical protein DMH12_24890 [Streptomyces sp. WAC 04229]
MSSRTARRRVPARVESIEERLALPTPARLPGQEAIPVATIAHHTYEGTGPCRADDFGTLCGAHRDAHHHTGETHA